MKSCDYRIHSDRALLSDNPIELPKLDNVPLLHQQDKRKIKVLIALITEMVARNSNSSGHMLKKFNTEVEHIRADHFEDHLDEFTQKSDLISSVTLSVICSFFLKVSTIRMVMILILQRLFNIMNRTYWLRL